jgi:hypothetical protein
MVYRVTVAFVHALLLMMRWLRLRSSSYLCSVKLRLTSLFCIFISSLLAIVQDSFLGRVVGVCLMRNGSVGTLFS